MSAVDRVDSTACVCVRCRGVTWFETWCSTWWAFNTAAAEFDAVLKNWVEGSDMRRQSNAVKPIVTALAILPHRLPCSIMMLKRATGMGLKLSTRRIVKQINSHFGTLYYWHSVHSPDYQWYLLLEVWEGRRVPASVSPRCPGKPRRWPWVSVHRAPARCTQTPLHLLPPPSSAAAPGATFLCYTAKSLPLSRPAGQTHHFKWFGRRISCSREPPSLCVS